MYNADNGCDLDTKNNSPYFHVDIQALAVPFFCMEKSADCRETLESRPGYFAVVCNKGDDAGWRKR